jgi:hypothetical protein
MQRELQARTQRELQQESKSSASDNEESDDSLISSSGPRSLTAASEQLPIQRQLQQESRSSRPDNEENNSLPPRGIRSLTAAILDTAIAVLNDTSSDEVEDSVEPNNHDDSNSPQ